MKLCLVLASFALLILSVSPRDFFCPSSDGRLEEENKNIVRQTHEEVWSKGNMTLIDELYAPDYIKWPYTILIKEKLRNNGPLPTIFFSYSSLVLSCNLLDLLNCHRNNRINYTLIISNTSQKTSPFYS